MNAAGSLLACPDCDAIQILREEEARFREDCFRCGAVLVRGGGDRLNRALAYVAGAIPLFLAANWFPLLRLEGPGQGVEVTVLGAVRALHGQLTPLALVVLLLAVILPAIRLAGLAFLLLALRHPRLVPAVGGVYRLVEAISPWAQIEILLLALLIAFAKLAGPYLVVVGAALPCMLLYLVLAGRVSATLDGRRYWGRIGALR